jgi:hypothetical protein
MAKLPQYRVFLLRCWKEQGKKAPPDWRFALEDGVTHQRHGFADLGSLTAFLERHLEGEPIEIDHDPDEE